MEFFESLGKQLSEITAYDVKSYVDKAKNMVMNYTEMETKVREATNDDAWGASSTLMQDIAQGTFNFQLFNEIMPVIYKRFTEKEAHEWRQIYKALQLLEYLVKHGSERVVDDARSHLSMIKMLRNFHYIDDKGKDQGINVRNRSKELSELLGDLDRVRQERRKAKANKSKYIGVGSDGYNQGGGGGGSSWDSGSGAGPSFTSATGSRYGGFGSDTYNAERSSGTGSSYNADAYTSSSRSQARRDSFEEYDAGDDEVPSGGGGNANNGSARGNARAAAISRSTTRSPAVPAPIKKDTPVLKQGKTKEVNLFDFDDDDQIASPTATASSNAMSAPAAALNKLSLDDDFDDFQSAAPSAAVPAAVSASKPAAPNNSLNFFDMVGNGTSGVSSAPISTVASPQPQMRTSQHMPAGPNYSNIGAFGASSTAAASSRPGMMGHSASFSAAAPSSTIPMMAPTPASASSTASGANKPKPAASAFDFDDLFAASGAKGSNTNSTSNASGKTTIASLAQQKQSNSLWGSGAGGATQNGGSNNGDLLF